MNGCTAAMADIAPTLVSGRYRPQAARRRSLAIGSKAVIPGLLKRSPPSASAVTEVPGPAGARRSTLMAPAFSSQLARRAWKV